MKNKIVSFIPLRSGSKGIQDKNIKEINGKPLVYWCLRALQNSFVDKIVVAIDSDTYRDVISAFNFNKVIFYERDPQNAQDNSTTEDIILEYLGKGYENNTDTFLLVQATSPLLTSKDINGIVNMYNKGVYNSLLSVADLNHRFLWKEKYCKDTNRIQAISLNYDYRKRPLRQQRTIDDIKMENGAMYINDVDNIVKCENRLTEPIGLYEMNYYTHLEIDNELDWDIVELLLKEFIDGR